MVEVTLTEFANDTTKPKACWFPFQKQINCRRTLTADRISDTKLSKPSNRRPYRTEKNLDRKDRLYQKNDRKGGSVSTGTETDTSFLSEESPTTPRTLSPSRLSYSRNMTSDFSYQTNSIAEGSFMDHSPSRSEVALRSHTENLKRTEYSANYFADNGYDNDESIIAENPMSNPISDRVEKGRGELLSPPKSNITGTNCTTKQCWTNEVVEGGKFACIQARAKKPNGGRYILEKPVEKSLNDSSLGIGEQLHDSNQNNVYPLGRLMRFVSQDPEDTNNGAPLRRILCSSAPFRNRGKQVFCRGKVVPRQNRHGLNNEEMIMYSSPNSRNLKEENKFPSDEEAPNFYVEVEAMREQLNGIRDLEEIRAEDIELEEEIVNARTSSLVDEDSAFMESLEKKRKEIPVAKDDITSAHDMFDSTADTHVVSHKENEKQQTKRGNLACKKETSSSVECGKLNGKIQPRSNYISNQYTQSGRQRGKIDKLLSEMVTDRVLAMGVENDLISDPMGRERNGSKVVQTSSYLQGDPPMSHRLHERQLRNLYQGNANKSFLSRSSPRVKEHPTSSSFQPLDVSDLTELSYDQFTSNWRSGNGFTGEKYNSIPRNTFLNATQAWHNTEQGDWKQSDIGFYRKANTTLDQDANTAFSRRPLRDIDGSWPTEVSNQKKITELRGHACDISSLENKAAHLENNKSFHGKFDENFWKEDTDDINTAAFEGYGSESDSVFDDLKSQTSVQEISPRSSKGEPGPFEVNFPSDFGQNDNFDQYSLRKWKDHRSKPSDTSLPNDKSNARAPFLQ